MEELDIIFDPIDITVEDVSIDNIDLGDKEINIDAQQIDDLDTDIDTPFIIQTDGLSSDDALAFVKDVAEGKRKIAKAVRNKYETITNKESGITEYSTFEEMSAKIADIPITVPMGSAMEQNGGVLPFYDVYNETLKAMKEFAGYGFNGCCAFELNKWDYDNDHTITLSGASAYYTSDKGELITTDTDYRFKDIDQPNTNRFVVYFFDIEEGDKYQVPKSLPATSCLGLWCIKGTPLVNFNADFTLLNSINVYDGELNALSSADFYINNITSLGKVILYHIEEINYNAYLSSPNLSIVSLPNLRKISGALWMVSNTKIKELYFPKIEEIGAVKGEIFGNPNLTVVKFPSLKSINNPQGGGSGWIFYNTQSLREVYMPMLESLSTGGYGLFMGANKIKSLDFPSLKYISNGIGRNDGTPILETINLPMLENCNYIFQNSLSGTTPINIRLGKPKGTGIKILQSGTNARIVNITIEKGFATPLNLTGCNGLSKQCVLDIFENLADLTEEGIKLNIIFGSATANAIGLTEDDYTTARVKGWTIS